MGLLRFLWKGVQEVEPVDRRNGFAPLIKLASSCSHTAGQRHRFVVFNLTGLVSDLGGTPVAPVALGGLRVGKFGIVLMGYAATDMWAVMRNVLWEDEHCLVCCGALMRFTETFDQGTLVRCGPTIGPVPTRVMKFNAGSLTDEYWTD